MRLPALSVPSLRTKQEVHLNYIVFQSAAAVFIFKYIKIIYIFYFLKTILNGKNKYGWRGYWLDLHSIVFLSKICEFPYY